jgi:hypothetical protein
LVPHSLWSSISMLELNAGANSKAGSTSDSLALSGQQSALRATLWPQWFRSPRADFRSGVASAP